MSFTPSASARAVIEQLIAFERVDIVHTHSAGATRQWDVVRRLAASWGYSRDELQRELWATIRTDRELVAA